MKNTDKPCYPELGAILTAGTVHVLVELLFSEPVSHAYNVTVSLGFLIYIIWRAKRNPGQLRAWGLRRDNFLPALRAQGWFLLVAIPALLIFGALTGSLELPPSFWLTIALYPVWGLAQQFALQNLIARNLAEKFTRPLILAVVASTLFAVSHYPRIELVLLTFVAGIPFTLIYRT